jgi:hypothetical protein
VIHAYIILAIQDNKGKLTEMIYFESDNDSELLEDLLYFVDSSDGPDSCWPWIGTQIVTGYGMVIVNGKVMPAHRAILSLTLGRTLGRWEFGCHKCDNPICCNVSPGHVYLGSPSENQRDARKARSEGKPPSTVWLENVEQLLKDRIAKYREASPDRFQKCMDIAAKHKARKIERRIGNIATKQYDPEYLTALQQ